MMRYLRLILLVLLGASVAGSGAAAADSSRIVSIGGSVTEIIYELGLADRIVAVDTTSLYPEAAMKKPNVGYMRQLSAEPILGLDPSLVIAIDDAGPPVVLDQLRQAGLPVVMVPDDHSVRGVLDKVTHIADALGVAERGKALRGKLEAELDAVTQGLAKVSERPRVLFLLSISSGARLAGGRATSADGIIDLAGGVNAAGDFERFKPISPEAAIGAAPDVVIVTHRTREALGGLAAIAALPEIAVTPAGRNQRIVAMDGLLLLGFGPRTGSAIRELAGHLHPEIVLPAAQR